MLRKEVVRPYVRLRMGNFIPEKRLDLDDVLDMNKMKIIVLNVVPDSPAARCGIKGNGFPRTSDCAGGRQIMRVGGCIILTSAASVF